MTEKTEEKKQKYTDEQYLDAEYYGGDHDELSNIEMKLVVTRKEHECLSIYSDPHTIPAKTKVILETAIHADDGRVSNYLCLDCANEVLEEIYGEESDDEDE